MKFLSTLLFIPIIIVYGVLISIGFWLGRKLTDKIEEKLTIRREVNHFKGKEEELLGLMLNLRSDSTAEESSSEPEQNEDIEEEDIENIIK